VTRSLSRGQAVLLGGTLLTLLALAVVGLFAIGSGKWPWSEPLYLRAGFTEIRGIEPGSRVRVRGEEAGEVEAVISSDQPSSPIELKLRLQRKFRGRIRIDAYAQIVSDGIMGGKLVEIHPGSDKAALAGDGDLIASRPSTELADLARDVGQVLQDLKGQKESFGELVQNSKKMVQQGEETMASFQDVAEAVKRFPGVRSYVEDPLALLYRPKVERNRKWFAEADLFPPGQARLTAQGEQRLRDVVPWLAGLTRHKGAEVVVVSYADPKSTNPTLAQRLTRDQSEAVATYLKSQGGVHKDYWVLSRKVTPFGRGTRPPPEPDTEELPPARIEVLVFVPQS
jgi:outer membrane protein OmpA-like peptidoglycan-associated protein